MEVNNEKLCKIIKKILDTKLNGTNKEKEWLDFNQQNEQLFDSDNTNELVQGTTNILKTRKNKTNLHLCTEIIKECTKLLDEYYDICFKLLKDTISQTTIFIDDSDKDWVKLVYILSPIIKTPNLIESIKILILNSDKLLNERQVNLCTIFINKIIQWIKHKCID